MQGQKIANFNRNWQDTAVARTKNEVQSVTKKYNKKNVEPSQRKDGKEQNQVDPPDDLLNYDYNCDFFCNSKKLLVIDCVAPI